MRFSLEKSAIGNRNHSRSTMSWPFLPIHEMSPPIPWTVLHPTAKRTTATRTIARSTFLTILTHLRVSSFDLRSRRAGTGNQQLETDNYLNVFFGSSARFSSVLRAISVPFPTLGSRIASQPSRASPTFSITRTFRPCRPLITQNTLFH